MIEPLIESLKRHSKGRKNARRLLFKTLRSNEHLINDEWLLRKMRFNYLGDLSDPQLLKYAERIMEKLYET